MSKDKALRPYYAGPYYHHEALDGTGYPQGLLKKDIPYEAQIIRVADEFDAIVSKRQYKSHINISDALKIIIEILSLHLMLLKELDLLMLEKIINWL